MSIFRPTGRAGKKVTRKTKERSARPPSHANFPREDFRRSGKPYCEEVKEDVLNILMPGRKERTRKYYEKKAINRTLSGDLQGGRQGGARSSFLRGGVDKSSFTSSSRKPEELENKKERRFSETKRDCPGRKKALIS